MEVSYVWVSGPCAGGPLSGRCLRSARFFLFLGFRMSILASLGRLMKGVRFWLSDSLSEVRTWASTLGFLAFTRGARSGGFSHDISLPRLGAIYFVALCGASRILRVLVNAGSAGSVGKRCSSSGPYKCKWGVGKTGNHN